MQECTTLPFREPSFERIKRFYFTTMGASFGFARQLSTFYTHGGGLPATFYAL
jgi:hypothetical protein